MTYKREPDRYTHRAKKEGFAARSVYKLEEIDKRLRLLKPGGRVLDLGAAPGSWTQYAGPKVGPKGKVVALDLEPLRVPVPPHVKVLRLDIFATPIEELQALGPFDVVLSDMAPHTSGVREADVARSEALVECAVHLAAKLLVPNGNMVAKIFQGSGFEDIRKTMRGFFNEVRVLKPEAIRKESKELYLAGLGRKAS